VLDFLLDFDHRLFLYFNSKGNESFDFFWLLITNKFFNLLIYFFACLLIFKKTNFRYFIFLTIWVSILILVSDQTSNFFKLYFKRLRPCHNDEFLFLSRLVKSSCGGLYSFFSAHASNSFSLATIFFFLFKKHFLKGYWFFIITASLISYSRIYLGVHFPIDIFVGSIFGFVYGFVFYKIWIIYLHKLV
jgi:undecaprenyl-diphosphatase